MDLGNEESMIFRVLVGLVKNEFSREVGQMILKIPFGRIIENEDGIYSECTKENMLKKYLILKNLGLPVPPTFRVDKNGERYLITDLSENGKKIIIDNHSLSLPHIENFEELKFEAEDIALKAYQNGIYLSRDAYCIALDKTTNIGKLYILDFGIDSILFKESEEIGFMDKISAIQETKEFFKEIS